MGLVTVKARIAGGKDCRTVTSMAPMMQCQAYVNGNASKTYMLPPPANGPLYESRYRPPNGMVFTSKGRWRDMTVLGKFQYWPGWR